LARILGSGTGSRLAGSLQIEQEIANNTGAWYSPQSRDATTFGIYGMPAEGVALDEIETAIDAELARMAETGPTEEELERARRVTRADYVFAQDSQSGLARRYGAALAMGFEVEDVQNWLGVIDSVTVEDVREAAESL